MSRFMYKTTTLIQFFGFVPKMFSECELIANVNTQILETISIGQRWNEYFIILFFRTAKFFLSHFVVF